MLEETRNALTRNLLPDIPRPIIGKRVIDIPSQERKPRFWLDAPPVQRICPTPLRTPIAVSSDQSDAAVTLDTSQQESTITQVLSPTKIAIIESSEDPFDRKTVTSAPLDAKDKGSQSCYKLKPIPISRTSSTARDTSLSISTSESALIVCPAVTMAPPMSSPLPSLLRSPVLSAAPSPLSSPVSQPRSEEHGQEPNDEPIQHVEVISRDEMSPLQIERAIQVGKQTANSEHGAISSTEADRSSSPRRERPILPPFLSLFPQNDYVGETSSDSGGSPTLISIPRPRVRARRHSGELHHAVKFVSVSCK